jgi:hypothetical protein
MLPSLTLNVLTRIIGAAVRVPPVTRPSPPSVQREGFRQAAASRDIDLADDPAEATTPNQARYP